MAGVVNSNCGICPDRNPFELRREFLPDLAKRKFRDVSRVSCALASLQLRQGFWQVVSSGRAELSSGLKCLTRAGRRIRTAEQAKKIMRAVASFRSTSAFSRSGAGSGCPIRRSAGPLAQGAARAPQSSSRSRTPVYWAIFRTDLDVGTRRSELRRHGERALILRRTLFCEANVYRRRMGGPALMKSRSRSSRNIMVDCRSGAFGDSAPTRSTRR